MTVWLSEKQPMAVPVPSLTESSRSVLRVLASSGPVTRPKLGAILNLSKPTMSAAIAELSALGLVASMGSVQGAMGRSATVYGLGQGAGYVIGIDVGAAQVRAVAHTLDGSPLAMIEQRVQKQQKASIDDIALVVDEAARAAILAVGDRQQVLRSIAVAVPRIVASHPLGLNKRRGPEAVLRHLRQSVDVPVLLENNVNCAAIGELHYGMAKNRQIFVYLQVGVRIGLGIVVDGKLFRGFNGAAGEAGRLPFPWSASEKPAREGLEQYLGSDALIQRCVAEWPADAGTPPSSAKELFARAEAGEPEARHWVMLHAADIGRVVAACIGFLDPGLVVLGGGVGQNPMILSEVQRTARDLTWSTEIAVSSLGVNGTALGAMRLAADFSLAQVIGETPYPVVVIPSLEPAERR